MTLIMNLVEGVLLSWFISSLLTIKRNRYLYILLTTLFSFITIQFSNMFYTIDLYLGIITICLVSFISYFFVDDHLSKILFTVSLESVFYAYISYICIFGNEILPDLRIDLMAKILYFCIAFPFIKVYRKHNVTFSNHTYFILTILLVSLQFEASMLLQIYIGLNQKISEIKITAILFLINNLIFLYLIFSLSHLNKVHLAYKRLQQEKENNIIISQLYEEIKIIKHDLKNEYQLYKYYLDHNQINQLKETIEKKNNQLDELPMLVLTSNELVNTIINNKMIEAYTHNIDILVNISIEENIPIDDYELTELLCNLFDNAIENTNSTILFYMKQEQHYLHIKIENNYDGEFSFHTKKDSKNHGYGLKSIKKICEKYYSHPNIQYSNQKFIFTASLFLK